MRLTDNAGLTLIELIVTMTIISILAAGIIPLSQVGYKRAKELELRRNLRVIRTALDRYKELADEKKVAVGALDSGYPESLEILVEGVPLIGKITGVKKLLRRIPGDPMVEDGQWGLRSYADDPDSEIWGGGDVYDVFSMSDEQALDGSYYKDW